MLLDFPPTGEITCPKEDLSLLFPPLMLPGKSCGSNLVFCHLVSDDGYVPGWVFRKGTVQQGTAVPCRGVAVPAFSLFLLCAATGGIEGIPEELLRKFNMGAFRMTRKEEKHATCPKKSW